MRVVLLGPPGAGKGTQAKKMEDKWKVPQISTGDMLRQAREEKTALGQEAEKYMKAGSLVPDEIVIGIVRERLQQADCQEGFILDGFPRSVAQAEALDAFLEEEGRPLEAVLSVAVSQAELVDRMLARKREDDNEEVIKERLRVYEQQTHPLIDYYRSRSLLKEVDGLGSIDEIFDRIVDALQGQGNSSQAVVG